MEGLLKSLKLVLNKSWCVIFFFGGGKAHGLTLGYIFCHYNSSCIHTSLFHIALKH